MTDLAADYERLIDECVSIAGLGDCYWNERFRSALMQRGLVLRTDRSPHDRNQWYPCGGPMFAPKAYHIGSSGWPDYSLIVWNVYHALLMTDQRLNR